MTAIGSLAAVLLVCGTLFFIAGTAGLLRFPDVYTRLHALTKADNVGLGLMITGLAIQAEAWVIVGKLMLIWALVLFAGASVAYLIAERALQRGIRPWKR